MIVIIDYGMGNLRSVQKAIEAIGHGAEITSDPERIRARLEGDLARRRGIRRRDGRAAPDGTGRGILRGGARGQAVPGRLPRASSSCSTCSEEDGQHEGLGLLPGRVVRFRPAPGLKIPHMGWNTLRILRPAPIFAGLGPEPSVYFVHSYHALPETPRTSPPRPTIPTRSRRSSGART